jgi:hypothetical protein
MAHQWSRQRAAGHMNGAWQPPAGSTKAGGCFGSLLNRRTLGLPTDALEGHAASVAAQKMIRS